MGDIVTLPISAEARLIRLMKPDPSAIQRSHIDERFLEIANNAAAANSLSLQMLTNLRLGGCVIARDGMEATESFARGFAELHLAMGAPNETSPIYAAIHAWMSQPPKDAPHGQ